LRGRRLAIATDRMPVKMGLSASGLVFLSDHDETTRGVIGSKSVRPNIDKTDSGIKLELHLNVNVLI
jgi:hypothetical protein